MGAASRPASYYLVILRDEILDSEVDVWEGKSKGR